MVKNPTPNKGDVIITTDTVYVDTFNDHVDIDALISLNEKTKSYNEYLDVMKRESVRSERVAIGESFIVVSCKCVAQHKNFKSDNVVSMVVLDSCGQYLTMAVWQKSPTNPKFRVL